MVIWSINTIKPLIQSIHPLASSLIVAVVIGFYLNSLEPRFTVKLTLLIYQLTNLVKNFVMTPPGSIAESEHTPIGKNPTITKDSNQIGGQGTETCPDCPPNPYSLEQLLPRTFREREVSKLNRDMSVEKKLQKIVPPPDKIALCQALRDAGFNPAWNIYDIRELLKTSQGRQQLTDIDFNVRRATGLKSIKNSDISRCFPHYYTDYICRKTVVPEEEFNKKPTEESVLFQHEQEQEHEQEQVRQQKQEQQEQARQQDHCNLLLIQKDLISHIKNNKNIKSPRQVLKKSLQMIIELIERFQDKSKAVWRQFVKTQKFQVPGTSFHIPLSLLKKYDICFGH